MQSRVAVFQQLMSRVALQQRRLSMTMPAGQRQENAQKKGRASCPPCLSGLVGLWGL
jgi:hypothetical protein